MRIATVQKLLIFADVVLLAGAGSVGWNTWKGQTDLGKETDRIMTSLGGRLEEIRQPEINPPKPPNYAQLAGGGNLFAGKWDVKKPETAVTAPVETPKVQRLQLDTIIRVVGIQAPDMAYLQNKKGSDQDPVAFYYVGQEVPFAPGAFVKQVTANVVVFEIQGEEQPVIYERPSAAATPGTPGAPVARLIPVETGITSKPGSSRVEVSRDAVYTAQQKGPDSVLQGVRIGSIQHTDDRPAMAFDAVSPQSPLAKGGVQNGDYLVSINGERLTNQAEAVEYLKRNPSQPRYTVVLMRQGRTVVRTVEVK